jgi:hypothetical protein
MNDKDVLFFAAGSKNAANLSIFFSQCTDINIFIENFCQFTCAENTFLTLMGLI